MYIYVYCVHVFSIIQIISNIFSPVQPAEKPIQPTLEMFTFIVFSYHIQIIINIFSQVQPAEKPIQPTWEMYIYVYCVLLSYSNYHQHQLSQMKNKELDSPLLQASHSPPVKGKFSVFIESSNGMWFEVKLDY